MNQIFLYCLAVAAARFGIVVHCAILMSTHYHLVLTDTRGVHPDFTSMLNRLTANCTKSLRAWSGEVFNAAGPSVVELKTGGAVVNECGYTIANAVAAGAVRYAREWPGLVTRVEEIGRREFKAVRPRRYFDPNGEMPEKVGLRFELPAGLVEQHGEAGVRGLLRESVEMHENEARAECHRKGWKFRGADRARKTSPHRRATAYEVFGRLNPSFATKGGGRDAYVAAVMELREFQARYREALERWRGGDREVVFPAGTWFMRVFHRVRCAEFAPS